MELQQLKYFKAVADIGKISEAAESLFVSAPALSTSISRLEKELGFPLFDRTNNRILLNTQGQIFLKHVNQIFDSLESAKQELQQSLQPQHPRISLLSINSTMWVNPIAAFLSEYPQYTLSTTSVSLPILSQQGLDSEHSFLLAYDSDLPDYLAEELDSVFLFHAYPNVAIHKDHPLAKRAELDIRTLAEEKLFLPTPDHPLYMRLQKLFALYDLPMPPESDYSLMIRLKMVSENQGITFITNTTTQVIPSPNIRYIPFVTPFEPWSANLYWRKDQPLTQYEIALKDFFHNFYKNLHKVYVTQR